MPLLARRPKLRLLDALAGPHGVDGYLEEINPLLVTGECRAEVVSVERGTEESVTLRLRPNRVWQGFQAGQFVNVAVEVDGVRHQRCYSPACGEGQELEITVKRHPEGLVSNFLADRARPGMVLGLSQAEGDFRLPQPRPESVLLIGGGSGITPLMAILRTLLAEGYECPVALLHYAPDPARAIYREELERLAADHPNFTLVRSYTRAPGSGEVDGHFSPH
ncbi:MAG TPA: ferredoxin reductase, partial [Solirubrobacterales bacterium]|nr:ferredoxin reductase [Solirubrobacterales bacterium]